MRCCAAQWHVTWQPRHGQHPLLQTLRMAASLVASTANRHRLCCALSRPRLPAEQTTPEQDDQQ